MEFITITISATTLGAVGMGLQELPYKISNPAIQEIDKQVKAYLEQKAKPNERAKSSEAGNTDGVSDGPTRSYVDQDGQAGRANPRSGEVSLDGSRLPQLVADYNALLQGLSRS